MRETDSHQIGGNYRITKQSGRGAFRPARSSENGTSPTSSPWNAAKPCGETRRAGTAIKWFSCRKGYIRRLYPEFSRVTPRARCGFWLDLTWTQIRRFSLWPRCTCLEETLTSAVCPKNILEHDLRCIQQRSGYRWQLFTVLIS